MRTRRREDERDRRERWEADRTDRHERAATVADPPKTAADLVDVLAEGNGLTLEEAALIGGIEEAAAGTDERDGSGGAAPTRGGW